MSANSSPPYSTDGQCQVSYLVHGVQIAGVLKKGRLKSTSAPFPKVNTLYLVGRSAVAYFVQTLNKRALAGPPPCSVALHGVSALLHLSLAKWSPMVFQVSRNAGTVSLPYDVLFQLTSK